MRRLTTGGRIDRERPISFTWNGETHTGFAGDSLASALLGAGIDVIGQSVTENRPRGIMSAGLEEATGFAQIESGGASEPLVRLTALPLYEGLAGTGGRRIAKGIIAGEIDAARFDKRFAHCDVLIVGAGPAGLSAALVAGRAGARVIVAEADVQAGGALLHDDETIDGRPGMAWVADAIAALGAMPDVTLLMSTTASLLMDQNGMYLVQRVGALRPASARGDLPEQRLWHVRARRIVLATGALERPLVFQDNDRPGIMLAGAARAYLHRYALAPSRGVVLTNNDDAYRTVLDWHAAGIEVGGIVDSRSAGHGTLRQLARSLGIPTWSDSVVVGTSGDDVGRLTRVRVRTLEGEIDLETDLLAVSGGHDPNLNLHLQLRGATTYDARIAAAAPSATLPGQRIVGAANGTFSLADALVSGNAAARELVAELGFGSPVASPVLVTQHREQDAPSPAWHVPATDGDESRSFVDLHRDATVAGIERAVGAGVRHIEHIKRYTLVGTGVEQGRSAKTNAALLTASLTDRPATDVGTSGSRPPFEPIPFHLLGGRARGERYEPLRTTSLHSALASLGAVFEPAGQWLRPSRFPRSGETARETVRRECLAARNGVAIMDASTLGKIDVRGPDAAWFLDQLYVNAVGSIPVGRSRYSVMCHMDGSIFDDGVVMRTAADRFFVTTSTGHA
ncbi:MAG: 2Fe-2S iron-sulfur cluster-binding protein, partial [Gemmatimonadaceae bacterium]